MSELRCQTTLLSTSVTALCCLPHNTLISGGGGDVSVWRGRVEKEGAAWSLERRVGGVLERTVHGLVPDADADYLLVYGADRYTLLGVSCHPRTCHLSQLRRNVECEDWVVDARWTTTPKRQFVLLTAHSKLLLIDSTTCLVRATAVCSDRSLLYCGRVVYGQWSDMLVLGGTVHNEMVLWGPRSVQPAASVPAHKGVIFSLRFDEDTKRICSTSDDRTCRLWQVEVKGEKRWEGVGVVLLVTVFAHKARVWQSAFLPHTSLFATIGEDGGVMVWDERGECSTQSWLESSVLCVEPLQSMTTPCLAVGCLDGTLGFFPVSLSPVSTTTLEECVEVKQVRLGADGSLLTYKQTGELAIKHPSGHTTSTRLRSDADDSYAVLAMSPSRLHLATADITGCVSVFSVCSGGGGGRCVVEAERVEEGRIYSLHYLAEDLLAVCGPSGRLTLLTLNLTEEECERRRRVGGRLRLPESKQRWTTCGCAVPTPCRRYLVFGDRLGSLHLYRYPLSQSEEEPVQSLWRVHGTKGVTCVSSTEEGYVLTCGRDGRVTRYAVSDDCLTAVSDVRLPLDWPSLLLTSPSFGHLVVAFHTVYVCVWSLREQRSLVKVKCWGGHRAWDLTLDPEDNLTLVFLKHNSVHLLQRPLHTLALPLPQLGLHSKTINGCCRLKGEVYLSGSEDTTLRVWSVGSDGSLRHVSQVGSHVSSVRDVLRVPHRSPSAEALVLSVGGRAHIKLWTLSHTGEVCERSSHMVREEKELLRDWRTCSPLDLPDVRYMSVCVMLTSHRLYSHVIFTAASDSLIRVFGVKREVLKLELVDSWEVGGEDDKSTSRRSRCLLKVCCLQLRDDTVGLLVTSATDGYLTFYLVSLGHSEDRLCDKRRLERMQCHEGGINALSVTSDSDRVTVVSGGEDARLVVSVLSLHPRTHTLTLLSTVSISTLHVSQITGVGVEGRHIVSCAVDGRVCLSCYTAAADTGPAALHHVTAADTSSGLHHVTAADTGPAALHHVTAADTGPGLHHVTAADTGPAALHHVTAADTGPGLHHVTAADAGPAALHHVTTRLSLVPDIHGLHTSIDSEKRILSVCVFGIGVERIDFHLEAEPCGRPEAPSSATR